MYFNDNHLVKIKNQPHLLGHMIGFDKLTSIHSDWIKYCWDSDKDKALQAARAMMKTTSIVIVGSIRWLLFHPNDRIGIIRKKFDRASEVLRVIINIFELSEIKDLFKYAHGFYPEITESNKNRILFNFKTDKTVEASINAYGLNSSLQGPHLDKPILDDFVTLKDRLSPAERNKTKLIIQDIMTNVADEGGWRSTMFIGTPWHINDGWTVCPEPIKYDIYQCGILTDEQIAKKKKKITPVLWATNYELKHIPDKDLMFNTPNYGKWNYNNYGVYGHLDAAFDGSCTNALTFMSEISGDFIQGIGFHYDGHVKNWHHIILEKYKKYRCKVLYMETNADEGYTARDLRDIGINVEDYDEGMNKQIKISVYLYGIWSNLIWSDETDDEYMIQIRDWQPGAKPDDAPDSASSLIRKKFSKRINYFEELYKE